MGPAIRGDRRDVALTRGVTVEGRRVTEVVGPIAASARFHQAGGLVGAAVDAELELVTKAVELGADGVLLLREYVDAQTDTATLWFSGLAVRTDFNPTAERDRSSADTSSHRSAAAMTEAQ